MLSLLDLIYNGNNHYVQFNLGKTFDDYIFRDEDEYHLLIGQVHLLDIWSISRLLEKYYIQEVFELANCYLGSYNERFTYWHISKNKSERVRIAIFYDYAHPYRDNESFNGALKVSDKYTDEYKQYISLLEEWVNTGKMPATKRSFYEFNEIDFNEFESDKPHARYYKKANEEIRKLLRTEAMIPLKECADIIIGKPLNELNETQKVKTLDPNNVPSYPFIPELQAIDYYGSERIHKGDIVVLRRNSFFLVDKEPDFELYAPVASIILRAKNVCAEYLYIYLSSQTAQRIRVAFTDYSNEHRTVYLGGMFDDFPIILPHEDESVYKEEFYKISRPNERFYISQSEMQGSKTVEQIINDELMMRIKLNNEALVRRQLENDVSELNVCYANKAYKSTLIMAGSIMEALLIDWLSEIRGVDYFTETLQKREYDKENRCYKTDEKGNYIYLNDTKADLADYIDEIRDIKKPNWMQEATEANYIRKKRNLVHSKLCLSNSSEINENTCKTVIMHLENIIKSRWK